MSKHLRIIAAVLFVVMLMMQTGCAVADSIANSGDILGAVQQDLFGVKQNCQEIRVSLPRHAGYDVIEDKTAYSSLATDEQRLAYFNIESSLFFISEEWNEELQGYAMANAVIPDLSSAEIFMVKEAVLADHPEAFWITGNYSIGSNMHDGSYVTLYSGYSYDEILTKMLALEQSVISVLKEIPSNRSEYERELIIHNVLVRDMSYDIAAVEYADSYTDAATVYGALVEDEALCSGYSLAFKLLCNRVGISCATVKGISREEGHMWNIVRLDDYWYHVDVTWDDPITVNAENTIRYDYLNLTDEWISFDHEIAGGYERLDDILASQQETEEMIFFNFPLPECTATRYNFYEQNAVRISFLSDEKAEEVVELMLNTCREEADAIYLSFNEHMDYDRVVEWINNVVGEGIGKVNRQMELEGGRMIDHCIRIVRNETSPAQWSNLHCIKLVYMLQETDSQELSN